MMKVAWRNWHARPIEFKPRLFFTATHLVVEPEDIVVDTKLVELDQPLHIPQNGKHCTPEESSAFTACFRISLFKWNKLYISERGEV